jgi:DNA-binding response OmpR family regulator
MDAPKIQALLIDDDEKLGKLLTDYLARFGIGVRAALHPDDGIRGLKLHSPDIVILDVMLPGRDGFEVCREIRALGSTPIIMLTARGETMDRIVGMELGADDYLAKPFEPRELAVRIQAIVRRANSKPTKADEGSRLAFGELEIRSNERDAFVKGLPLELTSAEYELLLLLASHPGKKFDRDEIMNHLRGMEADVFSRSIDVLVSRLRSKIGDDPKHPKYIKTAWGAGYVFLSKEGSKEGEDL